MSFDALTSPAVYSAYLIALGSYFGLWILKNVGIVRLRKISATTTTYVDDLILNVLSVTRQFFIIGASLYLGFLSLHLDKKYEVHGHRVFLILVALQAIIWGKEAIHSWVEHTIEKKNHDASVKTSLGFLSILMKFILISAVFLFTLNNLGVNVSTFIAGLGVGGIAIALATQNILGDLFSSLSIVLDKPFVVGDFISLGEWMGTVEYVGLKPTRLRSLSGEQIVVSNSDLLASKIRNFKRMEQRRVAFQLGVTYSTKREDLKKAPALIEEIIAKYPKAKFDRANFMSYGPSSLNIDVVYNFQSPDFNEHAKVHEQILIDIHEAFENNNLEFAFPTQTIVLEKKKEEQFS